jgi:hypothetical protein
MERQKGWWANKTASEPDPRYLGSPLLTEYIAALPVLHRDIALKATMYDICCMSQTTGVSIRGALTACAEQCRYRFTASPTFRVSA